MPTVTSTYLGELRTESEHLNSKNQLITDAPLDNQGKGEAFSPTDLVATALGTCMMTIMGIYARNQQLDLKGTQISITKIMASNPRRIAEISVEFNLPKGLNLSEKHQEGLRNAARTCPVCESLHPELKKSLTINFNAQ